MLVSTRLADFTQDIARKRTLDRDEPFNGLKENAYAKGKQEHSIEEGS